MLLPITFPQLPVETLYIYICVYIYAYIISSILSIPLSLIDTYVRSMCDTLPCHRSNSITHTPTANSPPVAPYPEHVLPPIYVAPTLTAHIWALRCHHLLAARITGVSYAANCDVRQPCCVVVLPGCVLGEMII